jgi:hypothetical protein
MWLIPLEMLDLDGMIEIFATGAYRLLHPIHQQRQRTNYKDEIGTLLASITLSMSPYSLASTADI